MGAIDKKYQELDDFALIGKMADLCNLSIPKGIKHIKERPILHKIICNKEEMKEKIVEILS